MIKAIETEYNGYRFRSRLEARWAVFFDALGVKYQYEMEGFEFEDGTRYLPDFWLPNVNLRTTKDGPGLWVEVKGDRDTMQTEYYQMFPRLSYELKAPFAILIGEVNNYATDHEQISVTDPRGVNDSDFVWWDNGMVFMQCTTCYRVKYEFCESSYQQCEHCGGRCEYDGGRVAKAIDLAKSARFEHGETPRAMVIL